MSTDLSSTTTQQMGLTNMHEGEVNDVLVKERIEQLRALFEEQVHMSYEPSDRLVCLPTVAIKYFPERAVIYETPPVFTYGQPSKTRTNHLQIDLRDGYVMHRSNKKKFGSILANDYGLSSKMSSSPTSTLRKVVRKIDELSK